MTAKSRLDEPFKKFQSFERCESRLLLLTDRGQVIFIDSAEKPSVHPSRTSGRTVGWLKSLEIFRSC
jgi:hypothetical protein